MDDFRPEKDYYSEGVRFGEYLVTFDTDTEFLSGNDARFFFNDAGSYAKDEWRTLEVYSDVEFPVDWEEEIDRSLEVLELESREHLLWDRYRDEDLDVYILQSTNSYSLPSQGRVLPRGLRGRLARFVLPEVEPAQERFHIMIDDEDVPETYGVPEAETVLKFRPATLLKYPGPYVVSATVMESLLGIELWHDDLLHPREFSVDDDVEDLW